jgi:gas vesicle protein
MPSTLKSFVAGAAVGGAAAYLLDSSSGARRRQELAAAARRRKHDVEGAAKGAQATAQGVVAKAQHAAGGESVPPDTERGAPPSTSAREQPANMGSSS